MKYAQVLTVELIKQKKGYQRSKTNLMKPNDKTRIEKLAQKEMNKVSKKCEAM